MADSTIMEIPIKGMDCNECTMHVQRAIKDLPGVNSVDVLLAAEKAIVKYDPDQVDLSIIRKAVANTGYSIPEIVFKSEQSPRALNDFTKPILTLFGIVFGVVLFVVVFGEWLGLFEKVTSFVPFPFGLVLVILFGFPVYKNVIQAALRRQVISHTLMMVGVIAALFVGEWATAVVVVFFMRVGEFAEKFTTERARKAFRELTAMAPTIARVERNGKEIEVPVTEVLKDDVVVVRPGEKIPVDGEVISGQATINQAAITGESMPVEVAQGSRVYAATISQLGRLKIRTVSVGAETTFGRVIRMVEDAEANRADIQRIGDLFTSYYLPVVASIALVTFIFSRNPFSTAAVLLVACSCAFGLATPIAMLASIGAAAKNGLLIKGGKYLEILAKADTLLIDKTGTLTFGKPIVTDIISLNHLDQNELLHLAASAERYSEHPLAEAVRKAAEEHDIRLSEPKEFQSIPGQGVIANIEKNQVEVGSFRIFNNHEIPKEGQLLQSQGKTLLYVRVDGETAGIIAAADTLRPEAPLALEELKKLGVTKIELLTGDNEQTAAAIADQLGIQYRSNLLPEEKIKIVKEYQKQGRIVVMVGDGVNDAPALAQAQVGIAIGSTGTDIAIEAAHIVLMKDDWMQLPHVFEISHRTMQVIKMNLGFSMVYNIVGIGLAAFGLLPPVLAAAAQSLPDLGILGNSSRLLRQK